MNFIQLLPSDRQQSRRGASAGQVTIAHAAVVLVCLAISGGALALNVLAEPSANGTQDQQQDAGKTEIIRGTAGSAAKAAATEENARTTANASAWLANLQQAANAKEVSIDEMAFAISVLGTAPQDNGDQVTEPADAAWLQDWISGANSPFAGSTLNADAQKSLAEFFAAQANYATQKQSDDSAAVEKAAAKLTSAAQGAYQQLLNGFAAGNVTPDQLVTGLNWIVEARLAQNDLIENAGGGVSLNDLGQTLVRVEELYSKTQAGANPSAFLRSRYYLSRVQSIAARQAGQQELTGVATKHAMQHALSRYRLVLNSAPMDRQNLLDVTEAAKNRADSLTRYAQLRGDSAMLARANAEFQASLQILQAEVARRGDSPRNLAIAQVLQALGQ